MCRIPIVSGTRPLREPATTWRELRLLKAVAERYCLFTVVPSLVAAWSAAGKPRENSPPADQMPADIDDLRSRHDDPHAPPGPHNLQPDAAPSGPHTAPAAPPAQPSAVLDGDAPGPAAAALLRNYAPEPDMNPDIAPDMNPDGEANSLALSGVVADMAADIPPAVEGREAILRAFKRNGAQPQPAPQPQARPAERPWFAGPQPEPREELSEATVEELCAGFAVGNLPWPRRLLGPEPGEAGCRIPFAVLKRNRLA